MAKDRRLKTRDQRLEPRDWRLEIVDRKKETGNRKKEARQHDKLFCLLFFMLSQTIISRQSFKLTFPARFLQRQLGNLSHLFSERTLSIIKKTENKHFSVFLFVITKIIYTFAIQGLHFKAYRK